MSYRADREAAARWKSNFDTVNRMRFDNCIDAHKAVNNNAVHDAAFSALVYGLKLALQAAPDFLQQVNIDRAAEMILSAFPPEP
jgi:hypothetical protein